MTHLCKRAPNVRGDAGDVGEIDRHHFAAPEAQVEEQPDQRHVPRLLFRRLLAAGRLAQVADIGPGPGPGSRGAAPPAPPAT